MTMWFWFHRKNPAAIAGRPGHNSRQGDSLLRFLLVEVAQVTMDTHLQWRSKFFPPGPAPRTKNREGSDGADAGDASVLDVAPRLRYGQVRTRGESTLPIGILNHGVLCPMAIALSRPLLSNWRSGLVLSVFAVCLSGTSRGELACRMTGTYPPFCKALTSAWPCKSCACIAPANHRIGAMIEHKRSLRIAAGVRTHSKVLSRR